MELQRGCQFRDVVHVRHSPSSLHSQLLVRGRYFCLSSFILTSRHRGLKYVAKHRVERIRAIASELAKSDYDIVALQEVWVAADYAHIRSNVSKILPYAKYFYSYVITLRSIIECDIHEDTAGSGALGAGLALFSRFPITAATVQPYSLNGSPLDVAGGDWFVGKAATSIVIAHPVLGQVQIFNTHVCIPHYRMLLMTSSKLFR
jgi:sphingomyelin phosphodiesterase 2